MVKEQRDIDREEELARQKKVTDALAAHEKEAREEAEKRLEDPHRMQAQEDERLAEIDKVLNASVKAHDKQAAKAAKENA
jgi:hypothetical protein